MARKDIVTRCQKRSNRVYLEALFSLILGWGFLLSAQTPLVTGEVNKYARVTSVGSNYVAVDDVSDFAAGDTVMIMQMNGVRINAGKNLEGYYQDVVGSPGNYEILTIHSIAIPTKTITLSKALLNTYSANAKLQLIRISSYNNAVVNTELTCHVWDSTYGRGGVLAFMVNGVLTLNADINVTGKGFMGGIVSHGSGLCQVSDDSLRFESYSIWSNAAGYKGEGLGFKTMTGVSLYPAYMKGKGANMTGGGGGNGHHSGGGGGSNYGAGSRGDQEIAPDVCGGLYPGGRGGFTTSLYPTLSAGVYMGGGGGASVYLTTPTTSAGANGGGIVIIITGGIQGNGRVISAQGGSANRNSVAYSGAGGGGGGGSVIISSNYYYSNPLILANGGNGGDNVNLNGAGGGGGGGLILTDGSFSGTTNVSGGLSGTHSAGDPNLDGLAGVSRQNLVLPLNGFLFNAIFSDRTKSNIDSICEGTTPPTLIGAIPKGGSGFYSFQWQKSYDGQSWSDVASTSMNYIPVEPETNTLWFRRIVNDGAGLISTSKPVKIIVHPSITQNDVGSDTTICFNSDPEMLYPLNSGPKGGTGIYNYFWEESLNNITWNNASETNIDAYYDPQALTLTTYYRRIVNSGACMNTSTPITVTVLPEIIGNDIQHNQTICQGSSFSTITGAIPSGGPSSTYSYQWMSSDDNINWNVTEGSSTGVGYDPLNDSPGTLYYRRIVYSGLCQSTSNVVQLTCLPAITNNIISSAQIICEGSTHDNLNGSLPQGGAGTGTYSYQWMNSSDGSTFNNIPGAINEDFSGISLTSSTWYRRVVNSSVCPSQSNDIKITVDPKITGFDISLPAEGHDTICTGDTPDLLDGVPSGGLGAYTYTWASSPDGIAFNNLPTTNRTYQSGALMATIWFRRTVISGECIEHSTFKITVLPLITGNTISVDQTVCNTSSPSILNGSIPNGGDGTFRYLWEIKNASSSDWVNAPGINNTRNYQPPILEEAAQFRRNVYSGEDNCCSSISSTVTITLDYPPTEAGAITGNLTICQGQNNITYIVPSIEGATSYVWALPSGAVGTSTSNSITVNYTTDAVSGDITVRGTNACGFGEPSTLAITVYSKPPTPIISLVGNVLHSDAGSGNQWYSQSGIISGATSQNYTITYEGDYYVIVTLSGCASDPSNTLHGVPTGFELPYEDGILKIYPNPVSDELIIETDDGYEALTYEIINSAGQIVRSGSLTKKIVLQIADLAPGVYVIKLGDSKTLTLKKIIKE